jgi:hypothetical protein
VPLNTKTPPYGLKNISSRQTISIVREGTFNAQLFSVERSETVFLPDEEVVLQERWM